MAHENSVENSFFTANVDVDVWEWECVCAWNVRIHVCKCHIVRNSSALNVASVFMFVFGMGRQFLNLSWQRQTTRISTPKFELLKIYCQQCHVAMQAMFVHIPNSDDAKWTDTTKLNGSIHMPDMHFVQYVDFMMILCLLRTQSSHWNGWVDAH